MAIRGGIVQRVARITKTREPTKREALLSSIRYAAYHTGSGVGAWFNGNRRLVSYAAMREAARQGIAAKERGIGCGCFECKPRAAS